MRIITINIVNIVISKIQYHYKWWDWLLGLLGSVLLGTVLFVLFIIVLLLSVLLVLVLLLSVLLVLVLLLSVLLVLVLLLSVLFVLLLTVLFI